MGAAETLVIGIVLVNVASELASIIILVFFLPKKIKIEKKDIIPDKKIIKEVLNIGIPTTGSRIIGSIGYFLEPIIITFMLLKFGYNNDFIINQYCVLNGYVLPLLMMPSFFTQAISSALIPVISKGYANNKINYVRNKLKQAIQDGVYVKSVDNIELSLDGSVYTISFTLKTIYGDSKEKLKFPFEDFTE
jgi:stage V sporulation protein B